MSVCSAAGARSRGKRQTHFCERFSPTQNNADKASVVVCRCLCILHILFPIILLPRTESTIINCILPFSCSMFRYAISCCLPFATQCIESMHKMEEKNIYMLHLPPAFCIVKIGTAQKEQFFYIAIFPSLLSIRFFSPTFFFTRFLFAYRSFYLRCSFP